MDSKGWIWPARSLRLTPGEKPPCSARLVHVADEVVRIVNLMDGFNRLRFAREAEALATWVSASNVIATGKPAPSGSEGTERTEKHALSGREGTESSPSIRPAA